ncbi:MAG: Two-component system response regulator [Parcubacteria group bacterium GW2011_GWB1_56_8]|nr:MAG: Two-component system response regulator [Parcubacteria group bacterium GW2011_GWB1_56_8]
MREKPLILIVDDEKDFTEIIGAKLEGLGCDVIDAQNWAAAVKQAQELQPDLILMDINMPGVSGIDAAIEMKKDPKTKNIRIAFLTSMKEPWPSLSGDNQAISQEFGMDGFLEKTDDLDTLAGKIQEILAKP